jgi:hypothetical protein
VRLSCTTVLNTWLPVLIVVVIMLFRVFLTPNREENPTSLHIKPPDV